VILTFHTPTFSSIVIQHPEPRPSTMKRILSLAALALSSLILVNCASEPVHVHHYHTRTVTKPSKSASVGGGSSPEAFQAVTPPSSYSQ
jgi:hypothetical protein